MDWGGGVWGIPRSKMPSRVETGHEIRKFDKDIDKLEFSIRTDILSNTCDKLNQQIKCLNREAIKHPVKNTLR